MNIDKHRKEAFITCPEDCPCWDQEAKQIKEEYKIKKPLCKSDGKDVSFKQGEVYVIAV